MPCAQTWRRQASCSHDGLASSPSSAPCDSSVMCCHCCAAASFTPPRASAIGRSSSAPSPAATKTRTIPVWASAFVMVGPGCLHQLAPLLAGAFGTLLSFHRARAKLLHALRCALREKYFFFQVCALEKAAERMAERAAELRTRQKKRMIAHNHPQRDRCLTPCCRSRLRTSRSSTTRAVGSCAPPPLRSGPLAVSRGCRRRAPTSRWTPSCAGHATCTCRYACASGARVLRPSC